MAGELVGDVLGDVFRGGVEGVEGRGGVEVIVVEGSDDFVEGVFDGVEVADEAVVVEGVGSDGSGDFPVVPVDGFLVSCDGDGVCCAELGFDGDFKHQGCPCRWLVGWLVGRLVWGRAIWRVTGRP